MNNELWLAGSTSGGGPTPPPSGYNIERSVRFNSADSAYLSRTPASAGNRKTWTLSLWVKRCKLGVLQSFTSSNNNTILLFDSNDKLCFYQGAFVRVTTQVFRDCSAWYHILLAVDTTNATAQNRARIYVNGNEITTWTTNTTIAQDLDTNWNAALAHQINSNNNSQYGDLYTADVYSIDGQALDPTSFGEFDSNGVWQPKAYTGSYGTNGFHLPFSDNSTAAALGTDTSGNGNTWTVNNISVAAGAGNDSLVDSPTNYGTDTGVGGEVRGNYCTLNPLITVTGTLSNGNLDFSSGAQYRSAFSTFAVTTGKWYVEGTVTNFSADALIGIASGALPTGSYLGSTSTSWSYDGSIGVKWNSSSYTAYGSEFTTNDVIGIAFDADTGKLWFSKNGVWQSSGDPASGANPAFTVAIGASYFFGVSGGSAGSWSCNFGQRPFAYAAPSGFKALNTSSLPAPVITKPSEYMDVLLWSGTGGNRSLTGLNMSPDFVWIKQRNQAYSVGHQLYDIVRGAGSLKQLDSSDTTAEGGGNTNQYGYLSSFDSAGFSVTAGSVDTDYVNKSGVTYVAWTWDAGSSTVTNTDGSITSQVRANPTSGCSIVTYTGTSSSQSVGHGLGVAPSLIITKNRDAALSWGVYHSSLGVNKYLALDLTIAADTGAGIWGSVTSTTFGISNFNINGKSNGYIAYCFAPVEGYSAFGSYTGNGSADGPFVYTGFRPKWVMVKGASSSGGHWMLFDTERSAFNVADDQLYANLSNAEVTANSAVDFLSNGFKPRADTFSNINGSGITYIYAAFAEHPFQYARAR